MRYEAGLLGLAGLTLFAASWELAAWCGLADPVVLSSPTRIAWALGRQWRSGELLSDAAISVGELALAFAAALAIGVTLAIAMALARHVEYALDPFLWFFYAAPIVAFQPLMNIWLGFGAATVMTLACALSIVPIADNTLVAIRSVDPLLVRAVRAFGGRRREVIVKVVLPASLPLVLAGVRIALGRALIGVVVGEMFSANAGLGYRMAFYGARLRTADVLAQAAVLVAIGLVITLGMGVLERRFGRWRDR